jgi:sec-independent protein translocase protein TatA
MGLENPFHLLFIAVVALVVLGPKRLPELARAAGKSMREFRDALSGSDTLSGSDAPHENVVEPEAQVEQDSPRLLD